MVLCIYFFVQSMIYIHQLLPYSSLVTLINIEGGLTMHQLEEMQKQNAQIIDSANFVAWGSVENQEIKSEELNHSKRVDVMVVSGESRILFPTSSRLSLEDKYGCLIDRESAVWLYGTHDVVGLPIDYNGTVYTIRGILRDEENALVIQMNNQVMESVLDTISIQVNQKESIGLIKDNFEIQYNIRGNSIDYHIFTWLLTVFLHTLPVLAVFFLCKNIWKSKILHHAYIHLVKTRVNRRNTHILRIKGDTLLYVVFYLTILLSWLYLRTQLVFPAELLPTKWSDFGFWERIWNETQDSFRWLLQRKGRVPESHYVAYYIQTVIAQIMAIVFCIVSRKIGIIKKRTEEKENDKSKKRERVDSIDMHKSTINGLWNKKRRDRKRPVRKRSTRSVRRVL